MGYYSEVALAMTKEAETKLKKKAKKSLAKDGVLALLNDAERYEKKDHDWKDCVLYHWRGLKWYERFADVSFMEKFVDSLNYDEYRMVRVGEDEGDVTEFGGLRAFNVYSKTKIHFEIGDETWTLSDGYHDYRVGLNFESKKPRFEMTKTEKALEGKIRSEKLSKEFKKILE